MADETNIRAAVERDLAEARERVRDMEGFLRVYDSFTAAATMPEPRQEDRREGPRLAEVLTASRPAVSLADDELSLLEAAEKVLRVHGRAMKAGDIASRMLLWGFKYTKGVDALRASVGGMLGRAVREGTGPFTRTAGVFGLQEWASDADRHQGEGDGDTLFSREDEDEQDDQDAEAA